MPTPTRQGHVTCPNIAGDDTIDLHDNEVVNAFYCKMTTTPYIRDEKITQLMITNRAACMQ